MLTVRAYNAYTSTTEQAVVNGGTPGTIRSGGNISLHCHSGRRIRSIKVSYLKLSTSEKVCLE